MGLPWWNFMKLSDSNEQPEDLYPRIIDNRPGFLPVNAVHGFWRGTYDTIKDTTVTTAANLAALGAEKASEWTGDAGLLFSNKNLSDLSAHIDNFAKKASAFSIQAETQSNLDSQSDPLSGEIAGNVAMVGGAIVAGLLTGGAADAAAVEGEAGEGITSDVANLKNSAKAGEKSNTAMGIVSRIGKFNATSSPYLVGQSVVSNDDGTVKISPKELAINLAIANTLAGAVELYPHARIALTNRMSKSIKAANAKSALKTEIPEPSEVNVTPKEKVTPETETLSQAEKAAIDDSVYNRTKSDHDIAETYMPLEEHLEDYGEVAASPLAQTEDATSTRGFIRAIWSKGVRYGDKVLNIQNAEHQAFLLEKIKNWFEYRTGKGMRQVYINEQAQKRLVAETAENKQKLNDLDKKLFDLKYLNSKNNEKMPFITSEKTGVRSIQAANWYRARKPELDADALGELNKMAKTNDTAKWLLKSYDESQASINARTVDNNFKNIQDAIANQMTPEEAEEAIAAYKRGDNVYFDNSYSKNVSHVTKELESANIEKYTDEKSPHYIQLMKNLNGKKLINYVDCMLRA